MLVRKHIPWSNPRDLFQLFKDEPYAHLFQSGDQAVKNRWSFIIARPSHEISVSQNQCRIDGVRKLGSIDDILRDCLPLTACCFETEEGVKAIPFISGLVGYIGYEAASLFEPSLKMPVSPYALPDIKLGRYEASIVFDHQNQEAFICGRTDRSVDELYEVCLEKPDLKLCHSSPFARQDRKFTLSSNFSNVRYITAVKIAKEAILNGDFFQTNLSRRIKIEFSQDHQVTDYLAMFDEIMQHSDASYGALLQFSEGVILSNSPEKFFSIKPLMNGQLKLEAAPIKGTIARHSNKELDRQQVIKLQNNPKDRAENIMIADLLRNDMSRVCEWDSIREDSLCSVLSLTHVHHLVSRISGILRPDHDGVDVLRALFPCGSITGAPKIEAMGAISDIEETGRGPYCGAIGYFDDRGNADFSVAIRILIQSWGNNHTDRVGGSILNIPVGGGITLRSDPQSEYDETNLKATALMRMLKITSENDL